MFIYVFKLIINIHEVSTFHIFFRAEWVNELKFTFPDIRDAIFEEVEEDDYPEDFPDDIDYDFLERQAENGGTVNTL